MTVSMNTVRGLGLYRKTTKQKHSRYMGGAELLLQRKRVVENGESGGISLVSQKPSWRAGPCVSCCGNRVWWGGICFALVAAAGGLSGLGCLCEVHAPTPPTVGSGGLGFILRQPFRNGHEDLIDIHGSLC